MPIEIKELVVRTIVTEDQSGFGDDQHENGGAISTDKIIEASVHKVLKILKKSKLR